MHSLHAPDPAVVEPHFDASGVVAAGQHVLNYALDLAAGWLVGFEDYGYCCAWDYLGGVWYGHGWRFFFFSRRVSGFEDWWDALIAVR